MGQTWQLLAGMVYSGKGVSGIGTNAVMWLTTVNTTLLKTSNAPPENPTHTHTHTEQKHLGVLLLIKSFCVCLLAATCKQESAFGRTNITADHFTHPAEGVRARLTFSPLCI